MEFAEWMAYYGLEPFGDERADLRSGIVAATIANVNRDPKKTRSAFEPGDFMPKFKEEEKEAKPWEDQLQMVEMLNAAFGGLDLREKKE